MIVKKESDRDVRQFSCFNAGFQGDHLKMYFYAKMLNQFRNYSNK